MQGVTQNANECFNHIVWRYSPKEDFNSPDEVKCAVSLATLQFNNGCLDAYSSAMQYGAGVPVSYSSRRIFHKKDKRRLSTAVYKIKQKYKFQRLQGRRRRKENAFCKDYCPGEYHSGSVKTSTRRLPHCKKCGKPMKGHNSKECKAAQ